MTKNDLDMSIFLNNIDYFCNLRGKKISDLERENGVSAGYFSRLRKKVEEGTPKYPKLSVALATAVNLRVPLEMLSNINFATGLSELNRQVLCYIGEIVVRTSRGDMSWSPIDISSLINYPGFQSTRLSALIPYKSFGSEVICIDALPPHGNGFLISKAYYTRKDWQTDLYYIETIRVSDDLYRMDFKPTLSARSMELWMHINGTLQIVMNVAMDNNEAPGHAMRALQNIVNTEIPKIPSFGTAIMNEIKSTIGNSK